MAFFRHRKYLLLSAIGIFILASLFYSFVIEPGRLVVTEHTIEIEKLDPALDGLKIVAISDLHCGSNAVNAEKLRDLLALANGQNPDIVVLLGDFVSEYEGGTKLRMPLDEMTQNIRGLKARYGVFAVMGNHDEINRLAVDKVANTELVPRKSVLIGSFARSLETNASLAGLLGDLYVFDIPASSLAEYMSGIDAITDADIQKFAHKIPSKGTFIIVGDYAKFRDALQSTFPDRTIKVIPAAKVDLSSPGLSR